LGKEIYMIRLYRKKLRIVKKGWPGEGDFI
jgi:hypothetical protein